MSETDLSFWEFDPVKERLSKDPLYSEHIEIPAEPDSKWCDLVSTYYGRGDFKTTLRADYFIREKIVAVGSPKTRHLGDPEEVRDTRGVIQAHDFIGTFMGFELRPELEGQEYNQALFANLLDVMDAVTGEVITGPEDVGLLIPVEHRVITLM